eukprot:5451902-Pleurochrysis_carterae.AAC.1
MHTCVRACVSTSGAPVVAAALRELAQRGSQFGFFQTTPMARRLPPEASTPGAMVKRALDRVRARVPVGQGYVPSRAAEMLNYEDVPPGASFAVLADGQRIAPFGRGEGGKDGAKDGAKDGRPVHVPYSRLQAFMKDPSKEASREDGVEVKEAGREEAAGEGCGDVASGKWGEPGWAVRSTVPIGAGQVAMEVCGCWRTDEQCTEADDKRYTLGLDDRARIAKFENGDPYVWLDLRDAGSIARLVNECSEAPNLELVTWPEDGPPTRFYFVAKHDIPAGVELAWERVGASRRKQNAEPSEALPASFSAVSGGGGGGCNVGTP